MRVELNAFQCCGGKCFFEKLVKAAAAEPDHESAFRIRMKNRACSNERGVRNDQPRSVVEIDGGFAIDLTSEKTAHLHDRPDLLDGDVIVRRLDRNWRYLSETIAGESGQGDENKTNHSDNWSANDEIHQKWSK